MEDLTSEAKRIPRSVDYARQIAARASSQEKARNEWEAIRDRIFKYVNQDLKDEGRAEWTFERLSGRLAWYLGKGRKHTETKFLLTKLEGLCKEAHQSGYGYKHRFMTDTKVAKNERAKRPVQLSIS